MRAHEIVQTLYCQNRVDRMLSRHEVFRLQLFAGARRESHSKMRQPFIPRANDAHLFGTILRREFRNRVQILSGSMRAEKLGACVECRFRVDTGLQPDFVEALLLPVGEKTNAVRARFDSVEMIFELVQRKTFLHILPHEERRLNIERYFCEDPECAETYHRARKCISVFLSR